MNPTAIRTYFLAVTLALSAVAGGAPGFVGSVDAQLSDVDEAVSTAYDEGGDEYNIAAGFVQDGVTCSDDSSADCYYDGLTFTGAIQPPSTVNVWATGSGSGPYTVTIPGVTVDDQTFGDVSITIGGGPESGPEAETEEFMVYCHYDNFDVSSAYTEGSGLEFTCTAEGEGGEPTSQYVHVAISEAGADAPESQHLYASNPVGLLPGGSTISGSSGALSLLPRGDGHVTHFDFGTGTDEATTSLDFSSGPVAVTTTSYIFDDNTDQWIVDEASEFALVFYHADSTGPGYDTHVIHNEEFTDSNGQILWSIDESDIPDGAHIEGNTILALAVIKQDATPLENDPDGYPSSPYNVVKNDIINDEDADAMDRADLMDGPDDGGFDFWTPLTVTASGDVSYYADFNGFETGFITDDDDDGFYTVDVTLYEDGAATKDVPFIFYLQADCGPLYAPNEATDDDVDEGDDRPLNCQTGQTLEGDYAPITTDGLKISTDAPEGVTLNEDTYTFTFTEQDLIDGGAMRADDPGAALHAMVAWTGNTQHYHAHSEALWTAGLKDAASLGQSGGFTPVLYQAESGPTGIINGALDTLRSSLCDMGLDAILGTFCGRDVEGTNNANDGYSVYIHPIHGYLVDQSVDDATGNDGEYDNYEHVTGIPVTDGVYDFWVFAETLPLAGEMCETEDPSGTTTGPFPCRENKPDEDQDSETRSVNFTDAESYSFAIYNISDVVVDQVATADSLWSCDESDCDASSSLLRVPADEIHATGPVVLFATIDMDDGDRSAYYNIHKAEHEGYFTADAIDLVFSPVLLEPAAPELVFTPQQELTLSEGATDVYGVALSSEPVGPVSIDVTVPEESQGNLTIAAGEGPQVGVADDGEGTITIVFTPADYDEPRSVQVTAATDGEVNAELSTLYPIHHRVNAPLDPGFAAQNPVEYQVRVFDKDGVFVTVVCDSSADEFDHDDTAICTVAIGRDPIGEAPIVVDIDEDALGPRAQSNKPYVLLTSFQEYKDQTFTITGVDDSIFNDNETVDIELLASSQDGDYNGEAASTTIEIIDDEVPAIAVTPIDSVTEEGNNANSASYTLAFVHDPHPGQTAEVTLAGINGTPDQSPVTVTDTAGVTISITTDDDAVDQGADYTGQITHTSDDHIHGDLASVVFDFTVLDNDAAAFTTAKEDSASEAGDHGNFSVALDTEPAGNVVVDLTADEDVDSVTPAQLTFNATNWDTPQIVEFTAVDDKHIENDIDSGSVTLAINEAGTTDPIYLGLSNGTVLVDIVDDDAAGIIVETMDTENSLNATVREDGGNVTYSIRATSTIPEGLVVNIDLGQDTSSQENVTLTPVLVELNSTNALTGATVSINATSDTIEGTQVYIVGHGIGGTTTYGEYNSVIVDSINVTVLDADSSVVLTDAESGLSVDEGNSTTFNVTLSDDPTADTTVTLSADSGVLLSETTLVFGSGNFSDPQEVTVTVPDDAFDHGVAYTRDIGFATAIADDKPDVSPADNITVTIADNDDPQILTDAGSSFEVREGAEGKSFGVTLSSQPTADVLLNVSVTTGEGQVTIDSDATTEGDQTTFVFNSTNWDQPHAIFVNATDDAVARGDINDVVLTIETIEPASDDPSFRDMQTTVDVTIDDNDVGVLLWEDGVESDFEISVTEGGETTYAVNLTDNLDDLNDFVVVAITVKAEDQSYPDGGAVIDTVPCGGIELSTASGQSGCEVYLVFEPGHGVEGAGQGEIAQVVTVKAPEDSNIDILHDQGDLEFRVVDIVHTPFSADADFNSGSAESSIMHVQRIDNDPLCLQQVDENVASCGDPDNDLIITEVDSCPNDSNTNQVDENDQDGDGTPDTCDDDIDGDGVSNDDDAYPTDGSESADSDGDGVGDNSDACPGSDDNLDADGDGIPDGCDDWDDRDDDSDGFNNTEESNAGSNPSDASSVPHDVDGDGYNNTDNGDGIIDDNDNDASVGHDSDSDGVDDHDDAFPNDGTETTDSDGDGVGDNADKFPNNASEISDADSDTIGDNSDNCPSVSNTDQADSDNDGDGDACDSTDDTDSDNDGFTDAEEEAAGSNSTDASSVPHDVDGDGYNKTDNGDGNIDDDDNDASVGHDSDSDGVDDHDDVCPGFDDGADADDDGQPDGCDDDRDGDGATNQDEGDAGSDPDNAESTPDDTDGDSIPNVVDDETDVDEDVQNFSPHGFVESVYMGTGGATCVLGQVGVCYFDDGGTPFDPADDRYSPSEDDKDGSYYLAPLWIPLPFDQ